MLHCRSGSIGRPLVSYGKTQHPELPGNVLAQPARPVRLPSGPPSSTQVCTCQSRSTRRCGRSPSMSGPKSTISCLRDRCGIATAWVSVGRKPQGREEAVGPIKRAWTARSQKRRPAPLPARRPEPPGGPLPWCGRARSSSLCRPRP